MPRVYVQWERAFVPPGVGCRRPGAHTRPQVRRNRRPPCLLVVRSLRALFHHPRPPARASQHSYPFHALDLYRSHGNASCPGHGGGGGFDDDLEAADGGAAAQVRCCGRGCCRCGNERRLQAVMVLNIAYTIAEFYCYYWYVPLFHRKRGSMFGQFGLTKADV